MVAVSGRRCSTVWASFAKLIAMTWVAVTLVLVLLGASYLLTTLRAIGRSKDEQLHYQLSAKFWIALAAFGGALVVALALPLLSHDLASTDAGMLTGGLIAVLPAIVIAAGLRNAFVLMRAHRRRRRAFAASGRVNAQVVSRSRWPLGQDLMALVVEADVPRLEPAPDIAYRTRHPDDTVRRRFVETCPGDHWARFSPGARVGLRYDPANLGDYAVELFAERSA